MKTKPDFVYANEYRRIEWRFSPPRMRTIREHRAWNPKTRSWYYPTKRIKFPIMAWAEVYYVGTKYPEACCVFAIPKAKKVTPATQLCTIRLSNVSGWGVCLGSGQIALNKENFETVFFHTGFTNLGDLRSGQKLPLFEQTTSIQDISQRYVCPGGEWKPQK